jgi:hypothetical protein
LSRLEQHRLQATKYYPIPTTEDLAEETRRVEGEPERMSTLIPSDYSSISTLTALHKHAVRTERKLRRTSCLKALQTVRCISIQQAQVTRTQSRQPRGQRTSTRSESILNRYRLRVENARWQYENSRKRLFKLFPSAQDVQTFKELRDEDMRQLSAVLRQGREPGQGRVTLPWYWCVSLSQNNNDTDALVPTDTNIATEHEESTSPTKIVPSLPSHVQLGLRVEWFRARERYCRWNEEIHWLQREAASVVLTFRSHKLEWLSRAHVSKQHAWRAYCFRKSEMWQELLIHAFNTVEPVIKVRSIL